MNDPSAPILEVQDAYAGYGRLEVVKGIGLQLMAGAALGLLGPNGHGKTTLLRAITGLGQLTRGSVKLDGQEIAGASTTTIVQMGLMHVPQASQLFPRLSVAESLSLAGRLERARPHREENLAMVFDLFPRLAERRRQEVGTMSGGERQMLAIAMGIMATPTVLILDEPTLGLAPKVRHEILRTLLEVRRTGLSLIVADGDVDFLFSLCDQWQVIELGRTIASGSTEDRPTHEQMMQMYVGATHTPSGDAAEEGGRHG